MRARVGRGFTLIELLVVMAILASLLSIVLPRYVQRIDLAKDAALRENLSALRIALDHYFADRGAYPEKLEELVLRRYLRAIPIDPVTDRSDTWIPVVREEEGGKKVVHDVHSGAPGSATDGTPYRSW